MARTTENRAVRIMSPLDMSLITSLLQESVGQGTPLMLLALALLSWRARESFKGLEKSLKGLSTRLDNITHDLHVWRSESIEGRRRLWQEVTEVRTGLAEAQGQLRHLSGCYGGGSSNGSGQGGTITQ